MAREEEQFFVAIKGVGAGFSRREPDELRVRIQGLIDTDSRFRRLDHDIVGDYSGLLSDFQLDRNIYLDDNVVRGKKYPPPKRSTR